ncbi:DUF4270 family protein [Algoriphagus sp. NG3]|uniref:DUF4270 family protein n=1 Tax=Algoriphagus sp. NG3 TaxID=3097546 RepID=UPI002A82DBAC|nr:DUF4270 family protein [Algoriphagus sp. NG3]WPR74809.1 DUF4270 family protein [Algoriphagus sp. NG3]
MALFFISSCSDPATVGIELAPGNNQIGVVFEEFELPAQVILLDSFNTTNQSRLIVGEEEDDFFGKTSAIGYSRMFISSGTALPETEAILDSVHFSLNIVNVDGINLDAPKYYSIHKLTEPILDTLYYNFDELSYESSPFSSGEIVFGEETDTLATFQVEEEFAAEIFSKMKEGTVFNNLFSFRDYFPGIAVKAREGDNTSIGVGVGTPTALKVYYHNEGDTVSKSYNITTASSRRFSGVKSDRSGTPTADVIELQKPYDLDPAVGMKSGLGMIIKLDTSPFDAFLDTLVGVTFNQIVLEIGELKEQASTKKTPANITMYFADPDNKILLSSSGFGLSVQADGYPQVAIDNNGDFVPIVGDDRSMALLQYNPDIRTYGQLITSHVNAIYRGQLTRKDWLLYGADNSRSLRQLVVDKNNIKVKVIYSRSR